MNRIRTIIDKEWAEVFKTRVVLLTVGIMPLVLTILPLVILYAMHSSMNGVSGAGNTSDVPAQFAAMCGNVSGVECLQMYMMNQFMLMFMMMPLAIPIAIAAYSVVGEKATRSLEPLLATPITTAELLAGKGLAAVIPAIVATFLGFAIFVAFAPLASGSQAILRYILSPTWLLAILVIGPLMAVLAVNFALIVSSRVSDPRVAEQISMVIIVPLLAVLFGQLAGVIVMNVQLVLVSALVLAVVDVAVVYVGTKLFQRETILTKWK